METYIALPDPGTNENMPDTGDPADTGEKPALFFMAGPEVFTGRTAALVRTGTPDFPLVAGKAIHIRCRATDILDGAFEGRHLRHAGYFTDDRVAAPALDNTALVMGEGTERAAAETPPVAGHRELHGFKCGDGLRIRRVFTAGERKLVDMIQFFR